MDTSYIEFLSRKDYTLPTARRPDYLEWKKSHPTITPEEFETQVGLQTIVDQDYESMIADCFSIGGVRAADKRLLMCAILTICRGKANPSTVSGAIDRYLAEKPEKDQL